MTLARASASNDETRLGDVTLGEQADLELVETGGEDGAFNPDGTVNVVIIRPGPGRGPGRRFYGADMLREHADVFRGWPMYQNHDTRSAKQARGGMPRSPTELGGVIRQSWWDPDYTASHDTALGFERGAVIGRAALTDTMEALVRRVPEAIKLSVNAQATGTRAMPGRSGQALVEGIVNDPENSSVDFVTKAGAGGEIHAALMESLDERAVRPRTTFVDALLSDEVRGYIRAIATDVRTQTSGMPFSPPRPHLSAPQRYRQELASGHAHALLEAEARRQHEALVAELPERAQAHLELVEAADDQSAGLPGWMRVVAARGLDVSHFIGGREPRSAWQTRVRARGLDPATFGSAPDRSA